MCYCLCVYVHLFSIVYALLKMCKYKITCLFYLSYLFYLLLCVFLCLLCVYVFTCRDRVQLLSK